MYSGFRDKSGPRNMRPETMVTMLRRGSVILTGVHSSHGGSSDFTVRSTSSVRRSVSRARVEC